MSFWYFINSGTGKGKFNMDFDNFLFDKLSKNSLLFPILRIYGWENPTISIGTNQSKDEITPFLSDKYELVKRITGGQMVLHRPPDEEITYSICIKYGIRAKNLYFETGKILLEFLKIYGLRGGFGHEDKQYFKHINCFSSKTSADIVVNGVKVIGSAQCRKKEYILQHGSIMLDKVSEFAGTNITFNDAAYNLKKVFQDKLKITFLDYISSEEHMKSIPA